MKIFRILLAFALLLLFIQIAQASIYVPDDYSTIQAAVDAANKGDTIIVRDGTYVENIDVNKQLTIKSENGSANCIVQATSPNNYIFEVKADYVNISGFTVKGAFGYFYAGILLSFANYCNISNNTFSLNTLGIFLWYSNNNTISNNNCSDEIYLHYSNNSTISNNNCSGDSEGISLHNSNYNIISNNYLSNEYGGIHLHDSNYNTISKNNLLLEWNGWYGINLFRSENNIIYLNNFISEITFADDAYTIIVHGPGVSSFESKNNIIYLNNFINTFAISYRSKNTWNSTSKITYSYKYSTYTNYMGNFWSGYTGSDANGDGIGDTPYSIADSDKDYHPLMQQVESYFVPPPIFVPDDYAKIQWAIDNATTGDTIIVRDGTYVENIDVNKQLTIKSENGSANCIVQALNPYDSVFEVEVDYVNIIGFTVRGAIGDLHYPAGMLLSSSNYCNISTNTLMNNYYGIELRNSNNNLISNNNCLNNTIGIRFDQSSNNSVSNNNCSNNQYGIFESSSNSNVIYLNNFINNTNNAYSSDSTNLWNSTLPITYAYNNIEYTNYLGNYWSDYIGSDNNSDGVGDTPYSIDSDKDYYPLMERFENYTLLVDTTPPASITNLTNTTYATTYVNWSWTNPPDPDFSHVMIYIDGSFVTNTSNNFYNATSFLPGTTHTISTHTVDTSGNINYTWVNHTATTAPTPPIYVPDDYVKIQWAIDNASVGDTIIVRNGTYYENVNINKQLTLIGEENPVVDAGGSGNAITLSADGIILKGFTVINSKSSLNAGIKVISSNNIIAGNTISNNFNGIYLSYSDNNNKIIGNTISNNIDDGIKLDHSSSNNILNNTLDDNFEGICLFFSNNNSIRGNTISNNNYAGIYLSYSNNNTVYLNNFIDNGYNVISYNSTNFWNSIDKLNYTYNYIEYTNYLGNYWSDYTGSDNDLDGIGDRPYSIDSDEDNYPLMQPWENYFVLPIPTVLVSSKTAVLGEKLQIEVEIANVTDLAGFQFDVIYNQSIIEFLFAEKGDAISDWKYLGFNPVAYNEVRVLATRFGGTAFNGSGTIAVLTFQVIAEGDSILDINDGLISDLDGQEIAATWVDGFVEVVAYIPGDLDGNGAINVLDLTILVNVILQIEAQIPAADVNGDGAINVVDLTALVNMILQQD